MFTRRFPHRRVPARDSREVEVQVHRIVVGLGSLFVLLVALSLPGTAFADEPSQAGLVVQFDDGRVETRCVAFAEKEITGADLLLAYSGYDIIVDVSSGMGITVCQIEAQGCSYPAEHCFCQCMGGGDCAYWNYFYREPGSSEWTYSALGAVLRKVQHGSVEAWVWGDGTTPPAFDGSFESICAEPTAEPSVTPAPPTATPTVVLPLPAATQPPEPAPTSPPSVTPVPPVPTPTPVPSSAGTQALLRTWPFGLMVLILVLIGLWVRSRRER
ncbi:MAG: hypothetical protein ACK2UA_13735 [Anaerolineae bacterium]